MTSATSLGAVSSAVVLAGPDSFSGSAACDVRAHGARGDGETLETSSLQAAIDTCARGGGGTVIFPPGRYLSGTLFLKDGVFLHLAPGAILLGSPRLQDYPPTRPALRSYTDNYTVRSLLYAENVRQCGISGAGSIDGQGGSFKGEYKVRPYLMRFIGCQGVRVNGITLKDSPMWVQHYLACDDVTIHGITVNSRCNGNNDGIDIDSCQGVRISDCLIISGDDAIVLKSTTGRICRDVVVTNCVLSSLTNAFKLGTESNGGFQNIALSNCTFFETPGGGLALELVDGGTLDGVVISNVVMRAVKCPIFIRLGNRARPFQDGVPQPGLGILRNIAIQNVQAFQAGDIACSVTGIPERMAENISLSNIRMVFPGGVSQKDRLQIVPELIEKYPEHNMFGVLPTYGLYCRHVRGLRLDQVDLGYETPDDRPALLCDDVEDFRICQWQAHARDMAVRLKDVRNGLIQGCSAMSGTRTFLRAEGRRTDHVLLSGNDLSAAQKPLEIGDDVSRNAVSSQPS
jgi:hypothetical protein